MFIFNPLFTIFILLLGGYMAKKIGVLKQKQSKMFLDFAILFALPCLIFDKTYHLNFDFTLVTLILIGFFSCMLSAGFAVMLGRFLQFSKAPLVSMFCLQDLETHFLLAFLYFLESMAKVSLARQFFMMH